MTKEELLQSIAWEWHGDTHGYHILMAGEQVHFTDDPFKRDLFIAALKAQILTQA